MSVVQTRRVDNLTKQFQSTNQHFQQSDYQLKYQRTELVRYDKHYVKNMIVVTRKYNRTTPVTNLTATFNVDINEDLVAVVQAYKFMSNEYRHFPVRMAANACKALAANVAGAQKFLSCGNFTGCPLLKGKTYHVCNFNPDGSKLPPFIPSGDFKLEIQGMYKSVELYLINVYASITRPIAIPP